MVKLIKFYSQTCPPCKVLDARMKEMGINPFESIDIGTEDPRVEQFGIMSVPTLVQLDDNGEEIGRIEGMGMQTIGFLKGIAQQ